LDDDERPMTRLAMIHTVAGNEPVFARLAEELLPGVETSAVVDESLLADSIAAGQMTDAVRDRLVQAVGKARGGGADAVLVTCSSVGAAVEQAAAQVDVPVVRVDAPMADAAVRLGERIGVLATLRTTLEPTADLVRRRALAAGKQVEVIPVVADGAFDALRAGDTARHDELVRAAFERLRDRVDVVVLAQASMARVVDALPENERTVPVLASPRLGMQHMATLLGAAMGEERATDR
jgi:Asp/Glu/hydantoin racemase